MLSIGKILYLSLANVQVSLFTLEILLSYIRKRRFLCLDKLMGTKNTFPKLYLYIPLLIAVFLYLVGIMRTDLWTPDEPRYAEVAREMIERGNYIQPYCNGEHYNEKPPLFFWTVAAGAKLFGDVNQLSVRLPSVLSALGIIALLMIFVSEFFGRKEAFLSAVILCISPEFFWLARSGHIDMLFTFLITVSLVSFYRWYVRERRCCLVIFYFNLALATLAKGPLGIALPLMVALCFLMARKEWSKINKMRLYIGLPFALAVVLAWYIPAMHQSSGFDFGHVVKRQIIGRVFHPTSHDVSIYHWPFYYLVSLAKGMAPWSILVPSAVVLAYRSRRDAPLFFLFCWTGVIFVFFTIIASKRGLYILPMYPAAASLIALWVFRSTAPFNLKLVRVMSASMGMFLMVFDVIVPVYLKRRFPDMIYHYTWNVEAPIFIAGIIAITAAIFGKKLRLVVGVLIGTSLIILAVIITSILPRMNEFKSPRNICNVYKKARDSNSEIAMFGGARTEYVFYTKSLIKVVQNRDDLKRFFDSPKRMFCFIKAKDYDRILNKSEFPIYVISKEQVNSRIMLLLVNQKVSPPF
ncbi:MAG: ArnT family glycosyltransferase [Candidatus Scalinduaceae bacterium]